MKPHSSAQKYDAVIVSAGHNSLTCAAYLARTGKNVLVLERKPHIGGASVTEGAHAAVQDALDRGYYDRAVNLVQRLAGEGRIFSFFRRA